MDKCENCGTIIGKLETPCVWQQSVVCVGCYDRLNGSRSTRSAAVVEEPSPHWGDDLDDLAAAARGSRIAAPRSINYSTGGRSTADAQAQNARNAIKMCIMISAIGNIIVGLIWAYTCIGIVLTIAMIAVCIFEFMLYTKIDDLPDSVVASKSHTMAIVEIVMGLFNLVSLVCGILNIIHASKLTRVSRG